MLTICPTQLYTSSVSSSASLSTSTSSSQHHIRTINNNINDTKDRQDVSRRPRHSDRTPFQIRLRMLGLSVPLQQKLPPKLNWNFVQLVIRSIRLQIPDMWENYALPMLTHFYHCLDRFTLNVDFHLLQRLICKARSKSDMDVEIIFERGKCEGGGGFTILQFEV